MAMHTLLTRIAVAFWLDQFQNIVIASSSPFSYRIGLGTQLASQADRTVTVRSGKEIV